MVKNLIWILLICFLGGAYGSYGAYRRYVSHWESWGEWSSCSETCGPGNETRVRECPTGDCGGTDKREVRRCLNRVCPGNGCQNSVEAAIACRFEDGNSCAGDEHCYHCICKDSGFKAGGSQCNSTCEEIGCKDDRRGVNQLTRLCGEHAVDCSGTVRNYSCSCNMNTSYPSPDGKYCIEAPCRLSNEFTTQCGEENSCLGTKDNFICECDGYGYIKSAGDLRHCRLATCENDELDPLIYCGPGGINCTGNVNDLVCECNETDGYIQSPDQKSCIPMPCMANPDVSRSCLGNPCVGSIKSWLCLCNKFGFRRGISPQTCVEAKCGDGTVNDEDLCGLAGSTCTGNVNTRQCNCDKSEKHIASIDGRRCIPAPCNTNKEVMEQCGGPNSCIGTYDSYTCVCNGAGFERFNLTENRCVEMQCDELSMDELEDVCGEGALFCNGTARNPICTCNAADNYHSSDDRRFCVKASCLLHPNYDDQCGSENSCRGTVEDFQCICDSLGYKKDPSDKKKCLLESCEDVNFEYKLACGKGATGCRGNIRDLHCTCDASKGFSQSADGTRCIPYTCYENPEVSEKCGEDNFCIGDRNDWSCVCQAYGYRAHPTNPKICEKIMCNDTGIDADMISVCGEGTISCIGHIAQPVCECNTTEKYLPSPDSTRCVKASCRENNDAMLACGIGNSCVGSYDEYICICDQYGYYQNESNPQECLKKKCEDNHDDYDFIQEVCGVGALNCTGFVDQPICVCNTTGFFHQSLDKQSCVKAPCSSSQVVKDQCGWENSCFGDTESFVCICVAPGYMLEPISKQSCILETCENGGIDYLYWCGKGAIGCTGNKNDLSCDCDNNQGYVQSADKKTCVANSCVDNPDVVEKCGMANTCLGSYEDWVCVCNGVGYVADASDPMTCKFRECSTADAIHVCGYGAIDCSGPVLYPTCSCDTDSFYLASEDGTSCEPVTCRKNETVMAQCGEENSCKGFTNNFVCICDAYGFKPDVGNRQICIERRCTDGGVDIIEVCGDGAINCYGQMRSPVCECNSTEYYYPNGDSTQCILASCKLNETLMNSCGEENSCEGNLESHRCVCDAPYFKHDPMDQRRCLKETCEDGEIDPMHLCGKGALSCNGTYDKYTCHCDNSKGYVQAEDKNSCIPSDCYANPLMHNQCGDLNHCIGSKNDWVCVCDAFGYKVDQTDLTRCLQKTCDEVDRVELCGVGATGCTGYAINPICECDEANYFVPSPDRRRCLKASCKSNITAVQTCGEGNSCYGTADNYVCICDAYGYRLDDNNNQACVEKTCNDANADYVDICGIGSIGCQGTVRNPVCECDATKHYVTSPDATSCILSNCRGNETIMAACGRENKCFGSASSFICVCDALGYKRHPSNLQECLPETCEDDDLTPVMLCGRGATKCKGNMMNFECECDTPGFVSSPDLKSCIPAGDCYANHTMHEQCGEGNKCRGTVKDWVCVCDGPVYKAHDTNFQMCHQRECSDADVDLEEVCGVGYVSCMGPLLNPICNCDISNHYVSSPDGRYCEPASCKTNETILALCGEGNSCSGTSENFVCICDRYGYRPHETDKQTCVERKCGDADVDPVQICGQGALSCTGTVRNPTCQCNNDLYYIPSDDRTSCVLASCSTNPNVEAACGEDNGCFGSKSSWICDCSSPGSMLNPDDIRECLTATCENGRIDPVMMCGKGAVACHGNMRNLTCVCDDTKGYVQSPDGMSCIASDCRANKTMHQKCGDENHCIGSLTDWVCICDGPGYMPDPNDMMKCHQKMCSDANIDPVDICGMGATKCTGPIASPRCTCNTDAYYVPSVDGTSCIPGGCQTNKTAILQCGDGNSCAGTADNFVCICDAHGYKLDDNDNQRCVEISCDDPDIDLVEICGPGSTGCRGKARQPICQCDHEKYFVPSLDSTSCLLASCRGNDTLMDRCNVKNTCFGSMTSHVCVCEAEGFKPNPLDPTECLLETCEDNEINALSLCGKGATSCTGTIIDFACQCDGTSYVESPDKTSCLPVSCRQNPEVKKACGEGNTCEGSYDDWHCLCKNPKYMPHATDMKVCLKRSCGSDPVDSCGMGATSCTGNINRHKCSCDFAKGYMPSMDQQSCVPIDCSMNPNMDCGIGNTCRGSYFSYVCECNTLGTMRNIDDPTQCIDIKCPTDALAVCGPGATGCAVTPNNDVNCTCGDGYHPGPDHHSCILDDCKFNELVNDKCGVENDCTGSISSWMCVCKGPKYVQDPSNTQSCTPGPCRIEQCGTGKASGSYQYYADSCEGTYFEHNCTCKEGFKKDAKGGCVVKSCNDNPMAVEDCGDNGKCEGTYFQYSCKCNEPLFIQNPRNERDCIPVARCNPQRCGRGLVNGDYMDFASACEGTYHDFTCVCKFGIYGNGTNICTLEKRTCAMGNDCHENANCIDYEGLHRCECKDGYTGDGFECHRNGGFSSWIVDKPCNKICDNGNAQVSRNCDNPTPEPQGIACIPSPDIREVPCNQFQCTECTARKSCGCKDLEPYFVEEYVEPDESLKYFTELTPEDVNKALMSMEKWNIDTNEEGFCYKIKDMIDGIKADVVTVTQTVSSTIAARDLMRKKIDCNVNIMKNEQYFKVYEAIVKRHFILKQVVKDLEAKGMLMSTHEKKCIKDSNVGWFSSLFG